MPQRAIVMFPSGPSIGAIEIIRRRFDPQATMLRAHITIVFPFHSELALDDLRSHLAQCLEGAKPFRALFDGISEADNEYIFLDVAGGVDHFNALHGRLYSGILREHLSGAHRYRPHITLGRVTNSQQREAAVAAIREDSPRVDETLKDLAVFNVATGAVEFTHRLAN